MELLEFFRCVIAMREAQTRYFKTPMSEPANKQQALKDSKWFESRIDQAIQNGTIQIPGRSFDLKKLG